MAKGGQFERDIAKALSLWWTKGANDAVFWRSSNSGGRATMRAKVGKSTYGQHGDIAAVDPIGAPLIETINIELKRGYNTVSPIELIDKKKNQGFLEFIDQAERDMEKGGCATWWLIHKRDRREAIIYMPSLPFGDFPSFIEFESNKYHFGGMPLDDFFAEVSVEEYCEQEGITYDI